MEKTMKLLKYVLPFAMATCGFVASMHAADDYSTTIEERETDIKALQDFVKSKGQITIQEKGGNLMLSGDIRGEWDHVRTWTRGKSQRGHGSSKRNPPHHIPFPTNEFDIEVNLMFDYRADRTWGKVQLQFDDPMGIRERSEKSHKHFSSHHNTLFGSGRLSNIALRKAYMGYNVLEMGTSRFDVELGRRRLYDTFDSKIQFHNFYDGVTLKFANSWEGWTDFQVKAAGFVIDQSVNHFGWIAEVGLLNLADEGVDLKYSFIHWNKNGVNRYNHHHPHGARFNNSQVTLTYNLQPDFLRFKSQVYGAFVHNHAADENHKSHHKKKANAWYAGLRMGEIKRQNDWAFDGNYQWVQAQAIAESDVRGIGRDNPQSYSFYKRRSGGFANYKGYQFTGLYALTDNLTLEAVFDRIHQCSRQIGGKHRSYTIELAAIYAF
jgi:hypothetical protein